MISIIVTTKNRPDFLFRCLFAIQKSTLSDFECVIIGDHCEYSEKVFSDFKDDKRFVYHNNTTIKQKNVGAVGKNIGIEMAKFNNICYCDDDNIILPRHLELMAHGLKYHDLVFTNFVEVLYGDADEYAILNQELYSQGGGDYICQPGYKDMISVGHTKELWKKSGGWKSLEEVGYNEDGYYLPVLQKTSKGSIKIEEITAIYNQHRNIMKNDYVDTYLEKIERAKQHGNTYAYEDLIEKIKNNEL